MGMGVGNSQPLAAQPGQQGGLGNSYVNPALQGMRGMMGGMPTPIQGRPGDPRFSGQTLPIRPPAMGGMPGNPGFPNPRMNPRFSGPMTQQPQGRPGDPRFSGQTLPIRYAEGGIASAAQNMADRGRNGDSMLVHMTPGEVKGLQALAMAHGGSLSINPDTGLVEASFLKKILPIIAGAALTPFLGPMGAALATGGFETLRTGDIGKGLMAGLGAYGGAGLTQGLTSAAGSAATEASAANALGAGANVGTGATSQAGMLAAENASMGLTPLESAANISSSAGYASGATPMSMASQTANLAGAGAQNVMTNPMTAGPQAYNAMPTGTVPALGATVSNAMTPEMPAPPGEKELDERYKGSPYRYNLAANFGGSTPVRPSPYYRPTGLGYAAGGLAGYAAGGAYDDEGAGDDVGMASGGLTMKSMSLGDGIYKDTDEDTASLGAYDAAKKRMEKQYAAANLKAKAMPKSGIAKLGQIKTMAEGGLGSYSDGGRMLKGPGDGMSDDIPAVIGSKQPARLADGEFVVPADVVSHLGNGSTDAGAKKLYSMMDKVRQARTGKKKQAPAVKTDKYLPA
jgi:hypothetical protein